MDVQFIIKALEDFIAGFNDSSVFLFVEIFLAIYVTVLFADIILLLILRGLGADIRTILSGTDMPSGSKGKMTKRWKKIVQRLESENTPQYKLAILEADKFIDEILNGIGYKGDNMPEKIEKIKPGQIESTENLLRAHGIRNEIIHKKDFVVDKKLAQETIEIYENFLKNLEFI